MPTSSHGIVIAPAPPAHIKAWKISAALQQHKVGLGQRLHWFELAFILSDDGFGLVLFVAIDSNTDAKLMAATEAAYAEATPIR